jgi:hypothetical protein
MQRFRIYIHVLGAKGIRVPFCNPSGVRTVSVEIFHVVILCRFLRLLSDLEGEKFPNCNLEFGPDITMILTTHYVQDYPVRSKQWNGCLNGSPYHFGSHCTLEMNYHGITI